MTNSDSRLDSAVSKGEDTPDRPPSASATFHRYGPTLPPVAAGGRVQLHWHARDVPSRISADTLAVDVRR